MFPWQLTLGGTEQPNPGDNEQILSCGVWLVGWFVLAAFKTRHTDVQM